MLNHTQGALLLESPARWCGGGAEAPAHTGGFTYYIPRPDERAPRVFKYTRPPYALLGYKCEVNMTTSECWVRFQESVRAHILVHCLIGVLPCMML